MCVGFQAIVGNTLNNEFDLGVRKRGKLQRRALKGSPGKSLSNLSPQKCPESQYLQNHESEAKSFD